MGDDSGSESEQSNSDESVSGEALSKQKATESSDFSRVEGGYVRTANDSRGKESNSELEKGREKPRRRREQAPSTEGANFITGPTSEASSENSSSDSNSSSNPESNSDDS